MKYQFVYLNVVTVCLNELGSVCLNGRAGQGKPSRTQSKYLFVYLKIHIFKCSTLDYSYSQATLHYTTLRYTNYTTTTTTNTTRTTTTTRLQLQLHFNYITTTTTNSTSNTPQLHFSYTSTTFQLHFSYNNYSYKFNYTSTTATTATTTTTTTTATTTLQLQLHLQLGLQLQFQLHYNYTTATPTLQLQLALHYTRLQPQLQLQLQLPLHYNYNYHYNCNYNCNSIALRYATLHPAVVGEVTPATIPKITTTFRSINGFALPSMHHSNSPLLQFPIFETSAIALCGTTGIDVATVTPRMISHLGGRTITIAQPVALRYIF